MSTVTQYKVSGEVADQTEVIGNVETAARATHTAYCNNGFKASISPEAGGTAYVIVNSKKDASKIFRVIRIAAGDQDDFLIQATKGLFETATVGASKLSLSDALIQAARLREEGHHVRIHDGARYRADNEMRDGTIWEDGQWF